jgi:hypothetical protein
LPRPIFVEARRSVTPVKGRSRWLLPQQATIRIRPLLELSVRINNQRVILPNNRQAMVIAAFAVAPMYCREQ